MKPSLLLKDIPEINQRQYLNTPARRAAFRESIRFIDEGVLARFARQHPRAPDGRYKRARRAA